MNRVEQGKSRKILDVCRFILQLLLFYREYLSCKNCRMTLHSTQNFSACSLFYPVWHCSVMNVQGNSTLQVYYICMFIRYMRVSGVFLGFYNHLLPEEFQRTTRLSIPQVAKKLPSLEKQTLVISNWWGLLSSSEFEPDGIVNKSLLTSAFHDLDAGGKVSSWLFFKLKCWENFSFHKKSSLATKYQFWHTGETLQISLICK